MHSTVHSFHVSLSSQGVLSSYYHTLLLLSNHVLPRSPHQCVADVQPCWQETGLSDDDVGPALSREEMSHI